MGCQPVAGYWYGARMGVQRLRSKNATFFAKCYILCKIIHSLQNNTPSLHHFLEAVKTKRRGNLQTSFFLAVIC